MYSVVNMKEVRHIHETDFLSSIALFIISTVLIPLISVNSEKSELTIAIYIISTHTKVLTSWPWEGGPLCCCCCCLTWASTSFCKNTDNLAKASVNSSVFIRLRARSCQDIARSVRHCKASASANLLEKKQDFKTIEVTIIIHWVKSQRHSLAACKCSYLTIVLGLKCLVYISPFFLLICAHFYCTHLFLSPFRVSINTLFIGLIFSFLLFNVWHTVATVKYKVCWLVQAH